MLQAFALDLAFGVLEFALGDLVRFVGKRGTWVGVGASVRPHQTDRQRDNCAEDECQNQVAEGRGENLADDPDGDKRDDDTDNQFAGATHISDIVPLNGKRGREVRHVLPNENARQQRAGLLRQIL